VLLELAAGALEAKPPLPPPPNGEPPPIAENPPAGCAEAKLLNPVGCDANAAKPPPLAAAWAKPANPPVAGAAGAAGWPKPLPKELPPKAG